MSTCHVDDDDDAVDDEDYDADRFHGTPWNAREFLRKYNRVA